MSADYFLDTNVLVYSFDDREPTKRDTAQKLIAKALRQGCGVISWQVVQEFLNVALHKWEVPMTTGDATAYLSGTLEPLCSVFPTAKLWHTALSLQEQNQYRFCDSLDRTRFTTAHEGTMYVQDMFPDLPGSAIRKDTFPYGPCWGILDPGMTMEKHRHPIPEFYVFTQGRGTMLLGAETFPVEAGMAVNIPRDMDHEVTNAPSAVEPLVWASIGLTVEPASTVG